MEKLNNCLICCCHRDNRKSSKCSGSRHIFNISENQVTKYNWSIKYIKSEVAGGRHITASLGSAGFTFLDDIDMLANYSYGIGDIDFYNVLKS